MKRQLLTLLAFGALCASAEAQGFSAWDVFTNSPDLTVESSAAAAGTQFGMQAVVNDLDILLVRDNTPNAEPRYRARFYFNTNNYDIAAGGRQRIFMAQRDSDSARAFTMIYRKVPAPSFLVRVLEEGGVLRNLPLGQFAEGWHVLEVDWQRETGASTNDGRTQVWVDGTSVANVTDLNNNSFTGIDFARMGIMNPVTGTGTLLFDEFESRRQTYIGPLP
jgi:hypothetical protein